ncbi:hypothetical protein [Salinigranum salinum]|uniref:hypothetical protein n=1 Tax=Salinigranum salinum TaxID=1364937 RepID=UPI00126090FE|nr:hypothetical protein [Salinigranum salinum]
MFDHDTNADEPVSRRSVLKTTGGLLAGSTVLAGFGAGRGAAETEEGLRIEVREMSEEYIVVDLQLPSTFDEVDFPDDVFLGHAERFVIHEDEETVSLPEDAEGLAIPVEMDFGTPHEARAYFRTGEVDLSESSGGAVRLGLGLFGERTVPDEQWDACPGHRDY